MSKGIAEIQHFRESLDQCFPTFFGSRHHYLELKIFGGTPSWFNRDKDQGIGSIGGTPCTSTLVCGGTPVGNHWPSVYLE